MTTRRLARRRTRRRLVAIPAPDRAVVSPADSRGPVRRDRVDPLGWVGGVLTGSLVRLGVVAPVADDDTARRIRGGAAVLVCMLAALSPSLALAVGIGGWHLPRLLARRQARRDRVDLDDEVFFAVQLCAVAIHTGTTVPQTIDMVADHLPGRLGSTLQAAVARYRRGALLDEELSAVVDELGEPVVGLIGILRTAHVDGDPVGPALARLGDRLRVERRRHTETEARRLSVHLLLPLVCCSLPGFVLIAVVPLAIDALSGLGH